MHAFPGLSDSDARTAEVTDALPRIPGVNLLAVHLTANGYAEIDRGRLVPEMAEIIDRAAQHGRPHLTAEELAAVAVQLPGFDPSLPMVLLGCRPPRRPPVAPQRPARVAPALAAGPRGRGVHHRRDRDPRGTDRPAGRVRTGRSASDQLARGRDAADVPARWAAVRAAVGAAGRP